MALISVHAGVGGSVSSVMDSSPLPRFTRRLLGLNGLSAITSERPERRQLVKS